MTKLDTKLRKILLELSANLEKGGYAKHEREAIVEGATEHAIDFINAHPNSSLEERRALIMGYGQPDFPPDRQTAHIDHGDPNLILAKFAWFTLAVTLLGIAALSPVVDAIGGNGGAVMSLFAIIGFPMTGVLSFLGRQSRLGRAAGYMACGVVAAGLLALLASL